MEKAKYKLGVALSGGGARGFAHCGALLALEEFGLKPDIIAGTSAGAIVGAAYCAGKDPFTIAEGFMGKEFSHFATLTIPRTGFFDQKPLLKLLREWLDGKSFDELNIPMRVEACDIDNGVSRTFSDGDLATCVLASASVPVVFRPVKIDGVHYVDGGVFKNLPVSPIREECEKIISIDVGAMIAPEQRDNIISIAMKSFYFMLNANTSIDISLSDIYIDIEEVGRYFTFDLNNINHIFALGYHSTVRQLEMCYGLHRIAHSRLRDLTTPKKRASRESIKIES